MQFSFDAKALITFAPVGTCLSSLDILTGRLPNWKVGLMPFGRSQATMARLSGLRVWAFP
jgi:hypothetical protein